MLNSLKKYSILSIWLVFSSVVSLPSFAYTITDASQVSFKIPSIEISALEDTEGNIKFEQLKNDKSLFKPLSTINFLKTSNQYWMVTKLENKSSIDKQLIFDKLPNWEKFKAYIIKSDEKVEIVDKNQSSYSSMINPSVGSTLVKITSDQFDSRFAQFNLVRGESITVFITVKAN